MNPIVALSAFDLPAQEYGNKSHYLGLLKRHGFDVPDGYALPALMPGDCRQYLEDVSIQRRVSLLLNQLTWHRPSSRIIVRSSSLLEDTAQTAAPGRYLTRICDATTEAVLEAVREVYLSGGEHINTRMGVVIQALVEAETSGIAYSCDPVTLERDIIVVESVAGSGVPLVEGKSVPDKVTVSYRNGLLRIIDGVISAHGILEGLVADVSRIESLFQRPVDIEWCVDGYGRRYVLQARPIVLGPSSTEGWSSVTLKDEAALPPQLLAHEKVEMRLAAERLSIHTSPAEVFWRMDTHSRRPNAIPIHPRMAIDSAYPQPTAKSIVVIQPRTVAGIVKREFIPAWPIKPASLHTLDGGQRIVRYPTYAPRDDVVNAMVTEAFRTHWLAGVIVQDVYDVSHTGLLARHEDGWLLEIAQGHFTSKGEVPASSFVLSSTYEVIVRNERPQNFQLRIIDGCTIREEIRHQSIDGSLVRRIAKELAPMARQSTVEFGVLPCRDAPNAEQIVFEIDVIFQERPLKIGANADVDSLSAGHMIGSVFKPQLRTGFDTHLHDTPPRRPVGELPKAPIVVVAELPTLSLAPLLHGRSGHDIAFVFSAGSFLCHFAILLRERGIPAIISASLANSLQTGETVEVAVGSHRGSFVRKVAQQEEKGPE
jgi:hypothetical protein